jgi:molybdopterin synthase sulfur carrier subunit
VNLLYFAWVRQKIGRSEEQFELPSDVKTIADLAAHLGGRGGGYADVFSDTKRLRAARNQEHVPWDAPVSADDEIAFFPPVTGG